MPLFRLLNLLFGYIRVRISGRFPERFLNLALAGGIRIWGITREGDDLVLSVSARGLAAARAAAERAGAELKVEKQSGLPFFMKRYRWRVGFVLGAMIFAAALIVLSRFVWSIEVIGNEKVAPEEILENLEELGFGVGSYIPRVDEDALKLDMLLKMPSLAWLSVNIKGTHATVEVHEATPPAGILDPSVRQNIVSSATGQILSIEVLSGTSKVKKGDVVVKGQVLVSCVVESQREGRKIVYPLANIRAATVRYVRATIPLGYIERVPTGRDKTRYSLKWMDKTVNFYFQSGIGYEKYDTIIEEKPLSLFGFRLPVSIVAAKYAEIEEVPRTLTEDEARARARALAEKVIEEKLPLAEITGRTETVSVKDGELVLDVRLALVEDIAQYAPADGAQDGPAGEAAEE